VTAAVESTQTRRSAPRQASRAPSAADRADRCTPPPEAHCMIGTNKKKRKRSVSLGGASSGAAVAEQREATHAIQRPQLQLHRAARPDERADGGRDRQAAEHAKTAQARTCSASRALGPVDGRAVESEHHGGSAAKAAGSNVHVAAGGGPLAAPASARRWRPAPAPAPAFEARELGRCGG